MLCLEPNEEECICCNNIESLGIEQLDELSDSGSHSSGTPRPPSFSSLSGTVHSMSL